ncbi:MAG TPA: LysR family transcriptional regulator [Ensifer sp.]|nr:LysR family transcriptional regulator [Ensifer sp.]
MKDIPWDLYQLFLVVARRKGLAGAAAETGLSPPTLGRKILALEELAGESYFHRAQTGYSLTSRGQALFNELQEMEAAARKLRYHLAEGHAPVRLRIGAGTWNTAFMIAHIQTLCTDVDPFYLDFHAGEERTRLAHRETDIGFRAFEPEEANLAIQKLPPTAYAIYKARGARVPDHRWVAVHEANALSTYLRWPHQNRGDDIVFTVNRAAEMRDLIVAGAGFGVLPCICGDREPALERVQPLPGLLHDQWLVMNRDDRHRPEIRTVINRIGKLFRANADLISGKRG